MRIDMLIKGVMFIRVNICRFLTTAKSILKWNAWRSDQTKKLFKIQKIDLLIHCEWRQFKEAANNNSNSSLKHLMGEIRITLQWINFAIKTLHFDYGFKLQLYQSQPQNECIFKRNFLQGLWLKNNARCIVRLRV